MMSKLKGETLTRLIQEYLRHSKVIRKHSEMTLKHKGNGLLRFVKFLNGRAFSLKTSRLYVGFLLNSGVSSNTVKEYFKVIKAFAGWLDQYDHAPYFLKKLELPKLEPSIQDIVSSEVAENMILEGTKSNKYDNARVKKAKKHSRLALRFALRTGVRVGGLDSLTIEGLDFENGAYDVRLKGGRWVKKPLPLDLEGDLKRLCRGRKGKLFEVGSDTYNDALKRGCKKLGIKKKITVHSLRRIFASTLAHPDTGVSPIQLAKQLNHSKVETTYKYYVVSSLQEQGEILNSRHPLIGKGVSVENKFEMLRNSSILKMIEEDPRIDVTIRKTAKKIEIRVDGV